MLFPYSLVFSLILVLDCLVPMAAVRYFNLVKVFWFGLFRFVDFGPFITWAEGVSLAKRWNVPFIETSAKLGENVEQAFYEAFKEAQNPQNMRCNDRHRKHSFIDADETKTKTLSSVGF